MPDETKRTSPADIYAEIRDRICLLDLAPGTALREADLAAEFGVSRTPVREALQRLGALGLVESRNGVGTFVTDLDADRTRQAYEMRLKIAELFGHMSPHPIEDAHVEAMDQFGIRARVLRADFDVRRYFSLNHEVHFLLAELIGNYALRDNWHRLYFQTARAWYSVSATLGAEVAADLVEEIDAVRGAMARRDPIAVGYIQRNYIAYAYAQVFPDGATP